MNCRDFETHIPNYLDGIPDDWFLREMEEHRASCAVCARTLAYHRYVFDVLASAEPVKAPAGLAARILAAAEAETAPAFVPVKPWYAHPMFIPLAAAVIFVAGAFAYAAEYLFRTPAVRVISDAFTDMVSSAPDLVTLAAPAWLYGRLCARWPQEITMTVPIPMTDVSVPAYFIAFSVLSLGVLGVIAWNYLTSPLTAGFPAAAHVSAHRG
jgi:hypothetical protein